MEAEKEAQTMTGPARGTGEAACRIGEAVCGTRSHQAEEAED